jgi:hypothetical protein
MDKSIRGLVSPAPDPAILECGMDFLRSAGFISILASRYVSLLDRARSLPNANLDASAFSNQQSLSRNEIETAQASNNGQEEHAHHLEQQHSHIDLSLFTQIEADDFEGINSLNSVFGTGLPQDFLAADWSQFDPVL